MPVEGNQQPFGLLHGGATCALVETVGSWAAALHAGPDRQVVGIELNVHYLRAATAGAVTAVCTPVRRGRTLATFRIEVTDDAGRPTASARLTCMILPERPEAQRLGGPSRGTRRLRQRTAPASTGARPRRRGRARQPAALPGREDRVSDSRRRPGGWSAARSPSARRTAAARPRARHRGHHVRGAGLGGVAGGRGQQRRARATPPVLAMDDEGVDGDLRAAQHQGQRVDPSTASPTGSSPAAPAVGAGPGGRRGRRGARVRSSRRKPAAAALSAVPGEHVLGVRVGAVLPHEREHGGQVGGDARCAPRTRDRDRFLTQEPPLDGGRRVPR